MHFPLRFYSICLILSIFNNYVYIAIILITTLPTAMFIISILLNGLHLNLLTLLLIQINCHAQCT